MEEKDIQAFNESMPYGTLPHERIGWLIEQYNSIEIMRLQLWEKIQEVKDYIGKNGGDPTILGIDSEAFYDGKVLKILIKDYLPRSCLVQAKSSGEPLRYRWLKAIVDAVNSLKIKGMQPSFNRAHCIITVYLPRKVNWDVDNRAYKFIIDGLRYADVIDNDTADKLVFTVVGEVDKTNPRTEITVSEYRKIEDNM